MKKLTVLMVMAAMVLFAGTVYAGQATSTFDVTATVIANCRITTAPADLAFGNYDPTDPAPTDGASSFQFKCTQGTDYDYYINDTAASGVLQMNSGTTLDNLTYALYTDAGRSSAFPQASVGVTGTAADNAAIAVDIYGRIPALQDVGVAADYVQNDTLFIDF